MKQIETVVPLAFRPRGFAACVATTGFFRLPVTLREGFPGGTVAENLPASAGDVGSIPGSGRSPGEGNGSPLHILPWQISQRNLAGYGPWGYKESDMTERACVHTHTHTHTALRDTPIVLSEPLVIRCYVRILFVLPICFIIPEDNI